MGGSFAPDSQGLDFAKVLAALGTVNTFAGLPGCRNGMFGFTLSCSKQLAGL